jgi:signal transduction histidine kinase
VVSCFPVAVAGAVVGAGLAIADVTPRRRRQELRTRLLAVATHDLKTPIFAILFTCQALLAGRLEGRQRRLVQGILSSARRVDGIVRDLVDYAVAERGGGVPIHRAAADMGAICRAVAAECEAAHPGRKVDCEGTGDAEGEWDADRVAQAITNLVGNALRYGDPEAAVLLRWRSDAGEAVAEVHNRGAPIPESLQPQLFDAFRRGPDERRGPGLGLGLYIAREIASAHGGRLELRSDAEGTVFTLTLPRRPP